MEYNKNYDEVENVWIIGEIEGMAKFTPLFVFADENMADLMLFCLERAIN